MLWSLTLETGVGAALTKLNQTKPNYTNTLETGVGAALTKLNQTKLNYTNTLETGVGAALSANLESLICLYTIVCLYESRKRALLN